MAISKKLFSYAKAFTKELWWHFQMQPVTRWTSSLGILEMLDPVTMLLLSQKFDPVYLDFSVGKQCVTHPNDFWRNITLSRMGDDTFLSLNVQSPDEQNQHLGCAYLDDWACWVHLESAVLNSKESRVLVWGARESSWETIKSVDLKARLYQLMLQLTLFYTHSLCKSHIAFAI